MHILRTNPQWVVTLVEMTGVISYRHDDRPDATNAERTNE